MPKSRASQSHSREFKLEAVRQVLEGGRSVADVSRELTITENLLYRWIRAFKAQQKPDDAFPGRGCLPSQEDELRRLRRENAQLREECVILKKATVYFAKASR